MELRASNRLGNLLILSKLNHHPTKSIVVDLALRAKFLDHIIPNFVINIQENSAVKNALDLFYRDIVLIVNIEHLEGVLEAVLREQLSFRDCSSDELGVVDRPALAFIYILDDLFGSDDCLLGVHACLLVRLD